MHETRVRIVKPRCFTPGFICEIDGNPIRGVRGFKIECMDPRDVPVVTLEIIAVGGVEFEVTEPLVERQLVEAERDSLDPNALDVTTQGSGGSRRFVKAEV